MYKEKTEESAAIIYADGSDDVCLNPLERQGKTLPTVSLVGQYKKKKTIVTGGSRMLPHGHLFINRRQSQRQIEIYVVPG